MSENKKGWSDAQLAARIADDLTEGMCVNLGIGLPTTVALYVPPEREVLIHSENGIIGMGPAPAPGSEDWDVVNASKGPVTLITGASIVSHADSFAIIRGGKIDVSILGGLQVAANGDLANWKVPEAKGAGGVGGAMDLVAGAKQVWVMMRHVDKHGRSKLMEACTFPLTGLRCVSVVYTDLGVFEVRSGNFFVRELAPGVSESDVRAATAAPLEFRVHA
jgi:3-oxoadipate CoA-transferase, beta subunit